MTTTSKGFRSRTVRLFGFGTMAAVGVWLLFRAVSADHSPAGRDASAMAQTVARSEGQLDRGRMKAEGLSDAFRSAARKVLPTVVVIKENLRASCSGCGRHAQDMPFDDNREDGVSPQANPKRALRVLGSGLIVAPSGIVLTNKHVVVEGREIVVQMADGRQFGVKRIKTDAEMDLAVLQIDSREPLPTAQLADSEAEEIGDWILAIGCPLELEQTVSAGIISAKNRSLCPNHRTRLLQTDAAINPGSSGGPLVNLAGEVIGITTSIASEDGGYQGIGFAIPASLAKRLVAQLTD